MAQTVKYPELSARLNLALQQKKSKGKYSMFRLAKDINRDYGYINRVMHGYNVPSREILLDLCRALGVSLEDAHNIFNETDHRAPNLKELEDEPTRKVAA